MNFTSQEITKLIDALVGSTFPEGDSAIDHKREENLKKLIDVINWCLDGVYDAARARKSDYSSMRKIGERAYASLLEWKEWIASVEEELS
ncbi:MAG: hypothetical protein J6Y13_09350 [Treponema sp.]|nr:hypothetical protein [Treponema sp.]